MQRECQALAFSSTINVENDERDPDQRLKNFLQKAQRKTQNIKNRALAVLQSVFGATLVDLVSSLFH